MDRDEEIGIGFFSDVYKGTWHGRTVAINILAESTPRKLFVWKTLRHPHVVQLYGASSATGDPPWFFISPYLKNGSLVEYISRGLSTRCDLRLPIAFNDHRDQSRDDPFLISHSASNRRATSEFHEERRSPLQPTSCRQPANKARCWCKLSDQERYQGPGRQNQVVRIRKAASFGARLRFGSSTASIKYFMTDAPNFEMAAPSLLSE